MNEDIAIADDWVPIFKNEDDEFFTLTPDAKMLGPYSTYERATEKYHEYCAYTIYAPACHHPHN